MEIRIENGEMLAPDGAWITQEAPVSEGCRGFFRRRVLLAGESLAGWRVATAEEKSAWDKKMEPDFEGFIASQAAEA